MGLEADLPGSSWSLERIVLADGSVLRGDGDQITFASGGTLTVSSCNICNGRYAVEGDQLTVQEPLGCTRRACLSGAIELERYLASPATLRRDGAYLVIEPEASEAEQILFVPARAVAPGS